VHVVDFAPDLDTTGANNLAESKAMTTG